MKNKIVGLVDAVKTIENDCIVAIGGNVLHRSPSAFLREIVRQGKKNLKVVKTAGAHDIDLLCAGGCIDTVDAGFVSYETEYGLAMHYRRAVESGLVRANEHACYTVISALRAAEAGIPFMPVFGLKEGDLISHNDYFATVTDPFSGKDIQTVKAIVPDVAIIHVQECDQKGNAKIFGPKYEDILISRASKRVIITTEQIIPESRIKMQPESVDIPYFLVEQIVHIPGGASPCSCPKKYNIDSKSLKAFLAIKTTSEFMSYLRTYEKKDQTKRSFGG